MEKTWDSFLSTLINSHPQAFLDLLLPGARCRQHHRTKLGGTQRQPDAVLEVERYREIFIYNPEFQSSHDKEMAERLLLYHMLLWCQHRRPDNTSLPVRSCVVSLWKRAKVAPSPLLWTQPGEPPGQLAERIRFSYETIEMWEIPHQVLLDLGHAVLYPLLPLTKGGATRKIINHMFDLLSDEPYHDFAVIGFLFAAHTFELLRLYDDKKWLIERFRHMQDFLQDSPGYQWIFAQGREEEKAQGLAQMRQAVMDFVQEYFPALAQLAEEVVATIDNPAQLVRLTGRLGGAQSVEQAHQILSGLAQ